MMVHPPSRGQVAYKLEIFGFIYIVYIVITKIPVHDRDHFPTYVCVDL